MIQVVLRLSHSNLNSVIRETTHTYSYEHTSPAGGLRRRCRLKRIPFGRMSPSLQERGDAHAVRGSPIAPITMAREGPGARYQRPENNSVLILEIVQCMMAGECRAGMGFV